MARAPKQPDDDDRARGRQLASFRRDQKISQRQLADHLGVSQQQVGKYEHGKDRMPHSRYNQAIEFLTKRPDLRGSAGFREPDAPPYGSAAAPSRAELLRALKDARDALERVESVVRNLPA